MRKLKESIVVQFIFIFVMACIWDYIIYPSNIDFGRSFIMSIGMTIGFAIRNKNKS